jgi:serine/threonine protein kinase
MDAATPSTPPEPLNQGDRPETSPDSPTPSAGAPIGPSEHPTEAGESASIPAVDGPDASAQAAGAPSSVPPELAQHHRYRILEKIESGGMGTVFKAQHLFLKRHVALKVVNQRLIKNWKMRMRFLTEMQAAAQLCHPNIVAVYDADVVGECSFLVMELVDGVALDKVVHRKGPMTIRQACDCARQTATGMQHALECNIVHRDIKPNNLMLTPQGTIKILDFGLALFLSEVVAEQLSLDTKLDSTEFFCQDPETGGTSSAQPLKTVPCSPRLTSRTIGTPDFLAPEMALDPSKGDVRADIYSLGCTLYFLVTGRLPFPVPHLRDKLHHHCHETPTPLRDLRPEIPERLALVIERMMAKSADDRYPTPAHVIDGLKPFASTNRGTVLLVDDDPLIRTTMTIGLQDQGFTVQVAQDGLDALNLLRSAPPPDLILLDLVMPGMDGFQFLQERQRDAALAAIPVVVLSGVRPHTAGNIMGAVDFLMKPADPQEIAQQIERYLPKE